MADFHRGQSFLYVLSNNNSLSYPFLLTPTVTLLMRYQTHSDREETTHQHTSSADWIRILARRSRQCLTDNTKQMSMTQFQKAHIQSIAMDSFHAHGITSVSLPKMTLHFLGTK